MIERYTVEKANGEPTDFETIDIEEARDFAREIKGIVIARIYEYTDSEMVDDYRE